jgi:hypothetical protein
MVKKVEEEKFAYCAACACEFDLESPDVKIVVPERNGRCVIELDGRAHEISFLSWKKIQARRALENTARHVSPTTLYYEEKEDRP